MSIALTVLSNVGKTTPLIHWKLDMTETYSRMRPKLAVLQHFNAHLDAIRGGAPPVPTKAEPLQGCIEFFHKTIWLPR